MAFGLSASQVALGGTVLGGIFGRKNKGASTTEKREPWGPAQPYLTQHLADNQQVMDHLKVNPFNAIQKQGYQGLLSDTDNFRQNVAPGLLDFANQGMTSEYKRPIYDKPGQAGGYGGAQPTMQGGLLSTGKTGPFKLAEQPAYGQIDWNAMNPFYKDPTQAPAAPAQTQEQADEAERRRLQELIMQNSGNMNVNAGFGA